jgi:hypothetical protein
MDKAEAGVGLMFSAYNLKRLISISGLNQLKKHLIEITLFLSLQLAVIVT